MLELSLLTTMSKKIMLMQMLRNILLRQVETAKRRPRIQMRRNLKNKLPIMQRNCKNNKQRLKKKLNQNLCRKLFQKKSKSKMKQNLRIGRMQQMWSLRKSSRPQNRLQMLTNRKKVLKHFLQKKKQRMRLSLQLMLEQVALKQLKSNQQQIIKTSAVHQHLIMLQI